VQCPKGAIREKLACKKAAKGSSICWSAKSRQASKQGAVNYKGQGIVGPTLILALIHRSAWNRSAC
jgi:hypothetical protein